MSRLVDTYRLNDFYKANNISTYNQEIMTDYLLLVARKVKSDTTIKNNVEIMKFIVTCIRTDLDKLTKKDMNHFADEIKDWHRKRDGKEVAEATKKQYKIGIKRFLKRYGEEIENKNMIELAKFDFGKTKLTRKLPEDLLSRDDVNRLIGGAEGTRDKALIATIYESGARRGEIEHCRIKDVVPNPNGFHMRLDGKTGQRQVLIHFNQTYLREWLNEHPMANDPNMPLFGKFESEKYIALDGKAIYYVIKKTAKKVGINGRCYPHLFRHSIATNMAKTLSEQQLKARFGWDQASGMTAVYVHLSGKDVDDTLLESYGIIEKKKEDGTKVNVCVRCGIQVSPGIRFCPNCGQVMTREAEQDMNSKMKEMLSIISKYPEMFADVLAKAQK